MDITVPFWERISGRGDRVGFTPDPIVPLAARLTQVARTPSVGSNSGSSAGLMPELGDRLIIRAGHCSSLLAQVPSQCAESGRCFLCSDLESWVAPTRVVDQAGDLLETAEGVAHQDAVVARTKGVHNQFGEVSEVGDGAHFQVVTQNDR